MIEQNSRIYNKHQHQFFLFQRELLHFAKNLETFIKTRVILHCTREFRRDLSDIMNMDILLRYHTAFLGKVHELCLLGQSSQKLMETIMNCLNNAIQLRECFKEFAALNIRSYNMIEQAEVIMRQLHKLKESHKLCMRFITGFMEKKTQHNFVTHLDDAYCRLNFNNFYSNEKK